MSRILVVATVGAGGDLQPLVATALAVRRCGHEIYVLGDRSVKRSLALLGLRVESLPPDLDLGPVLAGAI